MKYRHDEVLDLLDEINCYQDIQHISIAMLERPELFPAWCYQKYKGILLTYADLFIN